MGHDLASIYSRPHALKATSEPIALDVKGLEALPMVRSVSFSVQEGEILGLGGLVGAGRSEAAEAIFGLRPRNAGTISISGKVVDPKKPADAIKAGMGFVAEDRRTQNIVPHLSVKENLLLAHLGAHKGFGLGYASRDKQVASLLESQHAKFLRGNAAKNHHCTMASSRTARLDLGRANQGRRYWHTVIDL